MSPPVRTDPPYVPIRPTRWATKRTPWWVLAAVAVVLAGTVLVALVHRPSQTERASDFRGFLSDMEADIGSCAAGVPQSLTALRQIESGASHDVKTAVYIANTGASNCSPANNELLDDLEGYQVTESLASFHLARVVSGLVAWAAPGAVDVQTDVARILTAPSAQAKAQDTAALQQALRKLDAQRAAVDKIMESANTSLSAHGTLPNLPG
jgi:Tfp pilus assembly protein PilN